ncbi:MAG TPA: cytochrome c oxidase assembly protein [Vicinamibacterales bacterium]|nr:cytochrome c oxidase assembly protein [Vicinamibacterales bacterium]
MTDLLLAHSLSHAAWRHWTAEPVTIVLIVASAAVYALGVKRLWQRAGAGRGVRPREAVCFALGLFCLAIGLVSPIAWLSDILFSVHMTQHEILMLAAAPLLVLGRALHAFLWAFPGSTRETLGSWMRGRAVHQSWRRLSSPWAVVAIHGLVLWLWHVPMFFDAALASPALHAVQHLSFLLTAALFWWAMVHGRFGRIGYGAAVAFVFLTGLHSSVLGAMLTLAPAVWYSPYVVRSSAWNIDALSDQQLAGLIMWVPTCIVFIVFGLALLAAWLGESEKRARLGSVTHAERERAVQ